MAFSQNWCYINLIIIIIIIAEIFQKTPTVPFRLAHDALQTSF